MNECKRCGWCCEKLGHTIWATNQDIIRWFKENRLDILKQFQTFMYSPILKQHISVRSDKIIDFLDLDEISEIQIEKYVDAGDLIKDKCPFLEKNNGEYCCKINKTKPEICLNFICSEKTKKN